MDKHVGGESAKLTKLQIEDLGYRLWQYTPRDLYGPEASPCWTTPDLVRVIKKWYVVEYRSSSSYLRIFRVCDFSYQKVEKVYKPQSELKVLDFEGQVEKKLIDIAQEAPRTVFWAADKAGLYLQATTSFVRSVIGETPIMRADPQFWMAYPGIVTQK